MGAIAILGLFIILAFIGLLLKVIFLPSVPVWIIIALAWIIALLSLFYLPPITAVVITKLKNQAH
jgi:hypothetical protein